MVDGLHLFRRCLSFARGGRASFLRGGREGGKLAVERQKTLIKKKKRRRRKWKSK